MLSGIRQRINRFGCHAMQIVVIMKPHGAVILDDYNYHGPYRTATDEFLTSHRQLRVARQSGHLVLRET